VLRWVSYARHTRTGESPISERTGAMRTSQNSATAKFAEIVIGGVRSISVPRTRVNKAAASSIWATRVHQPLHQRVQEPPAHIYAQLRARFSALPIPMVKSLSNHGQRRTTRSKHYRSRMAEVRGSSPLGSTSLFLLFAGKNLRENCRSRTLLMALCSNAARAEARTRLLHWPPSRAPIVAFALG